MRQTEQWRDDARLPYKLCAPLVLLLLGVLWFICFIPCLCVSVIASIKLLITFRPPSENTGRKENWLTWFVIIARNLVFPREVTAAAYIQYATSFIFETRNIAPGASKVSACVKKLQEEFIALTGGKKGGLSGLFGWPGIWVRRFHEPRWRKTADNLSERMIPRLSRLLLESFLVSFSLFFFWRKKNRSQKESRRQPHITSQRVSDMMRQGHLHLQRAMVYQFS